LNVPFLAEAPTSPRGCFGKALSLPTARPRSLLSDVRGGIPTQDSYVDIPNTTRGFFHDHILPFHGPFRARLDALRKPRHGARAKHRCRLRQPLRMAWL